MEPELLTAILACLNDANRPKWATSATLIRNLHLPFDTPEALDGALVRYYQQTENPELRFSTLPSVKSLEVLWGSISRVGSRKVLDIYKTDDALLPEGQEARRRPNLFLSYSFKDSALVLELSRKLWAYGLYAWIAEMEILRHEHINAAVIEAIEALPFFGVFITHNSLGSSWSAKEVEFALRNKKQILGFIHTGAPNLPANITQGDFAAGSRIRQEIFSRFFDNRSGVRFLLYPEETDPAYSGVVEVLDWEEVQQ
ncbi:MAG: TIR domain-containing protein [Bacteroidetes bacterium]|nr:MAG: TIR domain-containing protein [Bacteroidota bacterium]